MNCFDFFNHRGHGGHRGIRNEEWKKVPFCKLLVEESISYGIVQPGQHQEQNSVPIIRVNNFKKRKLDTSDVLKVSKEIEKKFLRTRLEGGKLLITVVGSIKYGYLIMF